MSMRNLLRCDLPVSPAKKFTWNDHEVTKLEREDIKDTDLVAGGQIREEVEKRTVVVLEGESSVRVCMINARAGEVEAGEVVIGGF